ncbi:MAG: hypothetical protein ABIJ09_08675 [Pseudomonadota bacterium]
MSVNFNLSVNTNYAAFNSLSQISFGGASVVSSASFSAISDGFALAGGGINFASAFANLPPPYLPRPPHYSVSPEMAAQKMAQFVGNLAQFGGSQGQFGFGQFLKMSAMNNVVGNYMSTQALFGQSSISNLSVYGQATITSPALMQRELKDEFAAGNSAGKGKQSNMANSPETVLALNNILKGHTDNMPFEEVQKQLKDQYGIESKITDVDGRKALEFKNGDKIVDASGNGMLGTADYKFGDAVKSIKEKYGLSDEALKTFDTDEGKKALGAMSGAREQLYLPQEHTMAFGFNMTSFNSSWMGVQNNFLDMRQFEPIFAQAFAFAY